MALVPFPLQVLLQGMAPLWLLRQVQIQQVFRQVQPRLVVALQLSLEERNQLQDLHQMVALGQLASQEQVAPQALRLVELPMQALLVEAPPLVQTQQAELLAQAPPELVPRLALLQVPLVRQPKLQVQAQRVELLRHVLPLPPQQELLALAKQPEAALRLFSHPWWLQVLAQEQDPVPLEEASPQLARALQEVLPSSPQPSPEAALAVREALPPWVELALTAVSLLLEASALWVALDPVEAWLHEEA